MSAGCCARLGVVGEARAVRARTQRVRVRGFGWLRAFAERDELAWRLNGWMPGRRMERLSGFILEGFTRLA